MSAQSTAVLVSGISIFISGTSFLLILALLGRKTFQYASKKDTEDLANKLTVLGLNQSRLWRAMEAVDDRCDAAGLPVLRPCVPGDKAPADR